MKNPSDLDELCKLIVKYAEEGTPVKDAIEQSSYTQHEVIYELALEHFDHFGSEPQKF